MTQLENRFGIFIPETTQLNFFKNARGVHKYSVNDAVRVDFGIFPSAISGLQASTNFLVHLVNSNRSSLIY